MKDQVGTAGRRSTRGGRGSLVQAAGVAGEGNSLEASRKGRRERKNSEKREKRARRMSNPEEPVSTSHPPSSARVIFGLLVLNLVLRGLWLWYMHPPQISDFHDYYVHAVQLLDGQGYVVNGHPSAFRPMGYPLFLAFLFVVTGPHVLTGLIAQALLSTGIAILIYLLTLCLVPGRVLSQQIGMIGALGYTLLPSQIVWNSVLGTEELCTFLILLSLYVYVRSRHKSIWSVALSGIIMGLACDVREIVALYPVFLITAELIAMSAKGDSDALSGTLSDGGRGKSFAIWWQSARGKVGRVAVFGVFLYVAVAPIAIRNTIVMHHFVLVSLNGGQNLWQGIHTNYGYYWSSNPQVNPLLAAKSNEVLRNQIGDKAFLHFAIHHPWQLTVNGFLKIIGLYRYDTRAFYWLYAVHMAGWNGVFYSVVLFVSTWIYRLWMIVAIVGVYGVVRWRRLDWRPMVIPFSFILYNTLLMSVFPTWDRFRVPMMPEWAILFGMGWVRLREWLGRSSRDGGRHCAP